MRDSINVFSLVTMKRKFYQYEGNEVRLFILRISKPGCCATTRYWDTADSGYVAGHQTEYGALCESRCSHPGWKTLPVALYGGLV